MFVFPDRFTKFGRLEVTRDRGILELEQGGAISQVSYVDHDLCSFKMNFLALTSQERFEIVLMLSDQASKDEVQLVADGATYVGAFGNFSTILVGKHYNVVADFVGVQQ